MAEKENARKHLIVKSQKRNIGERNERKGTKRKRRKASCRKKKDVE